MNYDKLEELAKEKGVSKTFLCQIVGRERYYLRDCKKNNFMPPEDHIIAWAKALGTTVDYLTDKTEQKEKPTLSDDKADYMLQLFRKLSDKNKDILIEVMEKMLEGDKNND